MAFLIDNFVRVRPYLYHLTARDNLPRIIRTGRLESAARILQAAGRPHLVRLKRPLHEIVHIAGESIHVRDQSPLHTGNTGLPDGWTFGDFLQHLNQKVFFWPGKNAGPIPYGIRHHGRYRGESLSIIRVSTASVIDANLSNPPLFCKYNSGSPRCSNGKPSPRSLDTFRTADRVDFRPADVVEVVFDDLVILPVDAQVGDLPTGPWSNLT